jgi:hypothetical protein
MYPNSPRMAPLLLVAVLAACPVVQAADVTEHVPQDALGFAIVRDVAATSTKLESLAQMFQAPVPAPLDFFKLQTGFEEGFDENGDLLIALLPPQDEFAAPSPMALVPVTDYAAFVKAFNGDESGEICPVTVSDEDVLVAKRGDYALFMNPDARERMQRILSAEPAPLSSVQALGEWVNTNDGTVVVLPAGARMLVAMATEGLATARSEMEGSFDDLEMQEELATFQAMFEMYGKLLNLAGDEITAAALGLAIDETGNVHLGFRAIANEDGQIAQVGDIAAEEKPLAALPANGYVLAGGGPWPAELSDAMLRFSIDMMKSMPEIYGLQEASDEDLKRLESAFQKAVEGLNRVSFVMQPGEGNEPIYSNIYTLFEVDDARQYFENYKESLTVWNEIIAGGEEAKFEYEMQEEPVAGQPGLMITMDFSEAMGMPDFPQAQQMMEKMFGEGGKMRAYVAQVDENTVLIGYAVKPSVERMAESLRQQKGGLADDAGVAATRELLPVDAPFVAYISPQGCVDWFRRMMNVMMGALGGGGPVIPEYPDTPPVGIAVGLDGRVIETDVVLPAEMLKGLSRFVQENQ